MTLLEELWELTKSWLLGPCVTATITIAIFYLIISTWASHRRLAHISGPTLACFSQLWMFNATSKGDLYLEAERVLRQYGSPVRVGPNMILTDSPEVVRYMTAPRSPFRRGHWYKGMKFDPRINNLLSEQDEKRHADLRAKLMPGYTAKEVPALEQKIDNRILDVINLVQREYVDRNESLDFAKIVQYFTLDSLTDIAWGQPLGFLKANRDLYDYNKSSTAFFPVMELGTNIPPIHSVLSSRVMQALAGPKPEDKAGLGAIIGVLQQIVAHRFSGKGSDEKRDRDMLDAFIGRGLTQLEAESESLLQILAGSDSTATTIRMTFACLLTNPTCYVKLRKEVDEAIAEGTVSYPVVADTEAQRLPYLQACIKEGLRMWQPLNGIQTKILAQKEGVTVDGIWIPGGTQVALSQHNMMRRQDLFGSDADMFRPERWFADAETVKSYERVWELSFAAGRFTCLGKGLALMELNKIFVELLRRFDFGLVNPVTPVKTKCHQLHVQRDFFIKAWSRDGSS